MLTMGVSLMLRCRSGLAGETWTGASGAPMTPRRRRRSERRQAPAETDGAKWSRPFTHCPHPSFPGSPPPLSGPSSKGARIPDAGTSSSAGNPRAFWRFHSFGSSRSATTGEWFRCGLTDLDLNLAGDSPRAISPRRAERNPFFFSMPSPNPKSNPKAATKKWRRRRSLERRRARTK